MTIDPTTLPDGTVVEIDAGFHGAFYVDKDGYQTDREDINDGMPSFTSRDSRLSRVFVPVPEGMAYADAVAALADAGEWVEVANFDHIPEGARCRDDWLRGDLRNSHSYVHRDDLPPADPDVELVEAMARAISRSDFEWDHGTNGDRDNARKVARAALAVVREHEAKS